MNTTLCTGEWHISPEGQPCIRTDDHDGAHTSAAGTRWPYGRRLGYCCCGALVEQPHRCHYAHDDYVPGRPATTGECKYDQHEHCTGRWIDEGHVLHCGCVCHAAA